MHCVLSLLTYVYVSIYVRSTFKYLEGVINATTSCTNIRSCTLDLLLAVVRMLGMCMYVQWIPMDLFIQYILL